MATTALEMLVTKKCLDQTIHLIRSIVPFSSVIATGPFVTLETFSRWNIALWFYHLFTAKVLVMGGGSVFQSHTSFLSLLYYLMIVLVAKLLRCKVIILCHGWGPFKQYWHQNWILIFKNISIGHGGQTKCHLKMIRYFVIWPCCNHLILILSICDQIAVSLRSFNNASHSFKYFFKSANRCYIY